MQVLFLFLYKYSKNIVNMHLNCIKLHVCVRRLFSFLCTRMTDLKIEVVQYINMYTKNYEIDRIVYNQFCKKIVNNLYCFIIGNLLTRRFYYDIMLLYIKGRSGHILPVLPCMLCALSSCSDAKFWSETEVSIEFLLVAKG